MILLLFILLIIPGIAWAQCPNGTCFVRIGGNDSNDCSDPGANACATIQEGVDTAACGDTIDVGAGTFNQRTVIANACTSGNELTITGAGEGSTTPG